MRYDLCVTFPSACHPERGPPRTSVPTGSRAVPSLIADCGLSRAPAPTGLCVTPCVILSGVERCCYAATYRKNNLHEVEFLFAVVGKQKRERSERDLAWSFDGFILANVTLRTRAIVYPSEIPSSLSFLGFAHLHCLEISVICFANQRRCRCEISSYSPRASSCCISQNFDYGLRPALRMTRRMKQSVSWYDNVAVGQRTAPNKKSASGKHFI